MLCRGKAHSGTCAIAVASLVCGLHAASLPLVAQPLPQSADQPATDSGASFDERFSPQLRARPVFTHPEIQELLASLPPPADSAETLAAEAGPEPQPAENTASVAIREPAPEAAAPVPNEEMPLPEFPPPPAPAEVVLPSAEELAKELAAAIPPPPSPPPASPSESRRQTEASRSATSETRTERKPTPNRRAERRAATAKKPATAQNNPAVTGAIPTCPVGTSCVSQQQTFAIFFGFIAGALLGGPIGAIAGGAAGAIMTSGAPPRTGTDPAPKR